MNVDTMDDDETPQTKQEPKDPGLGHKPFRSRLQEERRAATHEVEISGHEIIMTIGFFEDGRPGELFIRMNKQGSTMSGIMSAVSVLTSLCLQYNVPLEVLISKFEGVSFEPAGITPNPEIPKVASVLDYVFRYLKLRHLKEAAP
jgi:ribonucleoside-diphosphate reductase alpha chain